MTIIESPAVSGGQQATAAQYNSLFNDILNRLTNPGGRLTPKTGKPVPVSTGGTAGGVLYYTPYLHNRIPLYDGTRWVVKDFSEISLALSTKKNEIVDLFMYDNAGTLTLEKQAWAQATVTADATAGSSVTISVSATPSGINSTLVFFENGDMAKITGSSAGASITVDVLENNLTTGQVVFYNMRASALGAQDNVLVKNGDATRRYLGTAKNDPDTANYIPNTAAKRHLWNYYNQVMLPFYFNNATSHTYNSSTVRKWNNGSPEALVTFIIGYANTRAMMRAEYRGRIKATSNGDRPRVGLGLDAVDAFDTEIEYAENQHSNPITITGGAWKQLAEGFHYLWALEAAASGSGTFSDISIKGGIFA